MDKAELYEKIKVELLNKICGKNIKVLDTFQSLGVEEGESDFSIEIDLNDSKDYPTLLNKNLIESKGSQVILIFKDYLNISKNIAPVV